MDQAGTEFIFVQLWRYDSVNSDVLVQAVAHKVPDTSSGVTQIDTVQMIPGCTIANIPENNSRVYIKIRTNYGQPNGPYYNDDDGDGGNKGPSEFIITKIT